MVRSVSLNRLAAWAQAAQHPIKASHTNTDIGAQADATMGFLASEQT